MTLEEAVQAAVDRARARCDGCLGMVANVTDDGQFVTCPHTCHGDLKVLEAALLAVLDETGKAAFACHEVETLPTPRNRTPPHTKRCLGCAWERLRVQIEGQFGEKERDGG